MHERMIQGCNARDLQNCNHWPQLICPKFRWIFSGTRKGARTTSLLVIFPFSLHSEDKKCTWRFVSFCDTDHSTWNSENNFPAHSSPRKTFLYLRLFCPWARGDKLCPDKRHKQPQINEGEFFRATWVRILQTFSFLVEKRGKQTDTEGGRKNCLKKRTWSRTRFLEDSGFVQCGAEIRQTQDAHITTTTIPCAHLPLPVLPSHCSSEALQSNEEPEMIRTQRYNRDLQMCVAFQWVVLRVIFLLFISRLTFSLSLYSRTHTHTHFLKSTERMFLQIVHFESFSSPMFTCHAFSSQPLDPFCEPLYPISSNFLLTSIA